MLDDTAITQKESTNSIDLTLLSLRFLRFFLLLDYMSLSRSSTNINQRIPSLPRKRIRICSGREHRISIDCGENRSRLRQQQKPINKYTRNGPTTHLLETSLESLRSIAFWNVRQYSQYECLISNRFCFCRVEHRPNRLVLPVHVDSIDYSMCPTSRSWCFVKKQKENYFVESASGRNATDNSTSGRRRRKRLATDFSLSRTSVLTDDIVQKKVISPSALSLPASHTSQTRSFRDNYQHQELCAAQRSTAAPGICLTKRIE